MIWEQIATVRRLEVDVFHPNVSVFVSPPVAMTWTILMQYPRTAILKSSKCC